jgi:hypothetical protein
MKTPHPLRNLGPRVFISYSFADRAVVDGLSEAMRSVGFHVVQEDESSLLGQRLRDILPDRIAQCEVFIPVITSSSAASQWVRQEVKWALRESQGRSNFHVLPAVLNKTALPKLIGEYSFVDMPHGLTDSAVIAIVNQCIHWCLKLMPLQDDNIFQFNPTCVQDLLKVAPPTDRKQSLWHRLLRKPTGIHARRTLLDSDGVLVSLSDEVMENARGDPSQQAQAALAIEARNRARIERALANADIVFPLFVTQTARATRGQSISSLKGCIRCG